MKFPLMVRAALPRLRRVGGDAVGDHHSSLRSTLMLPILVFVCALAGCGKKDEGASSSTGKPGTSNPPASKEDAFLNADDMKKPEEKRFLLAGKPFIIAIAAQKYDQAYGMLSSHARARMSLNQFTPSLDDAVSAEHEKNPLADVTVEQFAELMKKIEEQLGKPKKPRDLHVQTLDKAILTRTSQEQLAAIDYMFAIGAMPDSVPMDIRRASLRGQISTDLPPEQLEKIAKDEGVTVEELKKNPDFDPYFTVKAVLVEEDGQLKVGYFEFLPPSMMD